MSQLLVNAVGSMHGCVCNAYEILVSVVPHSTRQRILTSIQSIVVVIVLFWLVLILIVIVIAICVCVARCRRNGLVRHRERNGT